MLVDIVSKSSSIYIIIMSKLKESTTAEYVVIKLLVGHYGDARRHGSAILSLNCCVNIKLNMVVEGWKVSGKGW